MRSGIGSELLANRADAFFAWWARDYPPLDGRLRAIVYLLLLVMAQNGLLDAAAILRSCPDGLFEPLGITALFMGGRSPGEVAPLLNALRYPLMVAWVSAALGLFGRAPLVATGLGVVVFWGPVHSCFGTNHTWHLPLYVLVICGVLARPDRWSADWYLARRFPAYPFRPMEQDPRDLSSFARKLALVLSAFMLFSGGVAKLHEGGLAWADGQSLTFYLEQMGVPKGMAGAWLLGTLRQHPWAITALSAGTLVLELSSPLMLFVRRLRWPLVAAAWVFHFGIYLLMRPAYFPQMTCYLLILDWSRLEASGLAKRLASMWGSSRLAPSFSTRPTTGQRATVFAASGAVSIALLVTLIAQREFFPLSHVPMYSSYISSDRVGPFSRSDFNTLSGLSRVAQRLGDAKPPWVTNVLLRSRFAVQGARSGCVVNLSADMGRTVDRFLWGRRMTAALMTDLRQGAATDAETPGPFPTVQRVFSAVERRFIDRPEWKDIRRFRLVFVNPNGTWDLLATIDRGTGPDDEGRGDRCL